jgi:hypothetical protein
VESITTWLRPIAAQKVQTLVFSGWIPFRWIEMSVEAGQVRGIVEDEFYCVVFLRIKQLHPNWW